MPGALKPEPVIEAPASSCLDRKRVAKSTVTLYHYLRACRADDSCNLLLAVKISGCLTLRSETEVTQFTSEESRKHRRKTAFASVAYRVALLTLIYTVSLFGFASLGLAQTSSPQAYPQTVAPQNPLSTVPVPGELELVKLIWSTIAAVDNANQSGNYSVLRDLSATGFQINNNPARLAEIFSTLRASNIDLSNAMLVAPSYTAPPQMVQPDVLYLRGYFGIRPTSVEFELYYQWMAGKWRLYGVSIVPLQVAGVAPPQQARPAPAPVTAPEKKRNR